MNKKDLTKFKTPHTYAIIFCVVLFSWLITFLVPAGKFTTHEVEYLDSSGETKTKTVLMAETFRYSYNLNNNFLSEELPKLSNDTAKLEEFEVDKEAFTALVADLKDVDRAKLDEVGLSDDELYSMYGEAMYDKSTKLHKTAKLWGTDDLAALDF